ncbi:MAG TPA: secretin N-terminal domain-containing protein [Pyrinomonadaceae bacterium]
MLKTMKNVLAALVLVLIFITASFAQQAGTTTAVKSDDDFVTEKGFKSKVFDVKYRDAGSLGNVLRQLGSGFKGATVWASSEFKTITVRDFPENLATIEEALKRLDTPAPPRPNIELHMQVLVASNTSGSTGGTTAQVPAELKDVLTQLRETLSYRNYELATSVVQRLTETQRGLHGKGIAGNYWAPTPAGSVDVQYEYSINSVTLASTSTGAPIVQIGEFAFSTGLTSAARLNNSTQVQTALNLRDGEKVVVGTATLGDRALIIVLSAKLVP